jgi:hypothetical protein
MDSDATRLGGGRVVGGNNIALEEWNGNRADL